MKYECIENFWIDVYDADGFWTEKSKIVEKGSIWEKNNEPERLVGSCDTIRLERTTGKGIEWLEITEAIFKECFRELQEKGGVKNEIIGII